MKDLERKRSDKPEMLALSHTPMGNVGKASALMGVGALAVPFAAALLPFIGVFVVAIVLIAFGVLNWE